MKKTTSENLSKKLTKYGALTAAISGIASVNAQMGYTNPEPDIFVQKDGSYSAGIDFNDDSNNELIFYQSGGAARVFANSSYSVQILGSSNSPDVYPYVLLQSNPISDSQANWLSGTFQILNNYSGASGNWAGQTEKFLGIRFKIGTDMHYGWLRLTVPTNADDGITIHDFYYNPNANEAIGAGNFAVLGIEENAFSKTKIFALNKSINLSNLPGPTEYRLYSITGQSILEGKTNQNTYSIEANTIAKGIYIIELNDPNSNAVIRKKIVL